MKIQFLGGVGTVTGSKYFLETKSGKRALVDCGLFQGLKQLRLRNWDRLPVDPASLDCVILTHAHIDHSGYLPKLVKEGFRGPIFCTPATKDLCQILLPDAAYLMEEEANLANRMRYSKHAPALPLYTIAEAERALALLRPLPFHTEENFSGFSFQFSRAGHILGAAHLRLVADGTSIAFSGDLGRLQDPIMLPPEPLLQSDVLVVESTYGDRVHPETDPFADLAQVIQRTYARRGTLLVPAFAVGRAQHLLFAVAKLKREGKIPNIPTFLDSPMAINVTELYHRYLKDHRLSAQQCDEMCDAAAYVRTPEESKTLGARKDPRLIISASGMATGGRALHHIKALASAKENTILFAGYQAAGTRGANMVAGAKDVKIHGEYITLNCEVANLENFSAHADYREIQVWVDGMKPKRCFVTHGELGASDALRLRLQDQLKVECTVPQPDSLFSL